MLYDGKCVYWLGIGRVVTVDKVDVWLIEVVSDHDYQPTGLILQIPLLIKVIVKRSNAK